MEMEQIREYLKQKRLWDYIVIEELNKKHKGDIPAKEVLFLCAIGRKVLNKKTYSYNVLTLTTSSSLLFIYSYHIASCGCPKIIKLSSFFRF